MKQKTIAELDEILEETLNEFWENPDLIFADDIEHRKFRYGAFDELKDWKKNQECIVGSCRNKSIERSHTIHKAGSLQEIAEGGHVLTPSFNYKTEKMELMKTGINEASTFPGYCKVHENLFRNFEHAKDLTTEEDFRFQLYRTVCREIVINENQVRRLDVIVSHYKAYRDKKLEESLLSKLVPNPFVSPSLKTDGFTFKISDDRLRKAAGQRKKVNRYLTEFLYAYHDAILHDLQKKKSVKTTVHAVDLDMQIPVALAGGANFIVQLSTKQKNINAIINVLPYGDKTYAVLSGLKKNEKHIYSYMSYFSRHPPAIISMIETWMMHGSDHWFLKPGVWSDLNTDEQAKILDKLDDVRFNIGNDFESTIFKKIKFPFIQAMEDNLEKLHPEDIAFLQAEKNKIGLGDQN